MKTLRLLLLFCSLASVLCIGAASADRFDRTKARIDVLLDHRLKPGELPAKPANPFAFTGPNTLFAVGSIPAGTPTGPGPAVPVVPEPAVNAVLDDDQILAFCISRLRISGQVQRGDRAHLLINSATYKEGDLIPVRANAETMYYVKVVRIAPGEVIFGYNAVFVTLPLKT